MTDMETIKRAYENRVNKMRGCVNHETVSAYRAKHDQLFAEVYGTQETPVQRVVKAVIRLIKG